ncbi:carbohydrate kinase family protein [Solobacterium moorei]|uniref:Kinase n=1 Tax=Solobacterium moorei TaxID=102148 RepID=A0A412PDP6_9FIRM|nr:carbohydrate kinase family protein [Solobacterium moorei]MDI6415379.1 carbohydrate kinase family protein [Solobacterium moorei]RGT55173.1 kinase [Solobacterium moorei]
MSSICVIGGANIDIVGSSIDPLQNFDSNPGEISIAYGGVGRNIAQICALLGENIKFVTCFSGDSYGQSMKEDCKRLGMDVSMSSTVEDLPSSMYIALLDNNRDMKLGMSDMRILRRMDAKMLQPILETLHEDDIIIIDSNLDMESIEYIAIHAKARIAADPVSAHKATRLKSVLNHLDIFKPNQFEASELTGIWIKDEETARQNLDWFIEHGVKEVIISMADRGILLGTAEHKTWFTHRPINMENATGGGDSLLGAYVASRLAGKCPLESMRFGISAAVISIEQDAVRRRNLNTEEVNAKISDMKIEEKTL